MAMSQLPWLVETAPYEFLAAREGQPARQYEEGKRWQERGPKTDEHGELVFELDVLAMTDGRAEVIRVQVVGDPKVKQGELVRCEGLTAQGWERNNKYGITFRAAAIRPVNARSQTQGEKAAA